MRGLRADLAAAAEAARSTVRAAGRTAGPATESDAGSAAAARYSPEGEARLREAEMLVQAFRDDIRVELRRHAGRRPVNPVTLETVKTVLDQARISIRNSLDD
jgi:hypothetical protein